MGGSSRRRPKRPREVGPGAGGVCQGDASVDSRRVLQARPATVSVPLAASARRGSGAAMPVRRKVSIIQPRRVLLLEASNGTSAPFVPRPPPPRAATRRPRPRRLWPPLLLRPPGAATPAPPSGLAAGSWSRPLAAGCCARGHRVAPPLGPRSLSRPQGAPCVGESERGPSRTFAVHAQ